MFSYTYHIGHFPPRIIRTVKAENCEAAKAKLRDLMDRYNSIRDVEPPVGYTLYLTETDDPAFKDSEVSEV